MVAVELAEQDQPTVEDGIVLISLADGDLSLYRWTSQGYTTMDGPAEPLGATWATFACKGGLSDDP